MCVCTPMGKWTALRFKAYKSLVPPSTAVYKMNPPFSVALWGFIHLVQLKKQNPALPLVSAEYFSPVCSLELEGAKH